MSSVVATCPVKSYNKDRTKQGGLPTFQFLSVHRVQYFCVTDLSAIVTGNCPGANRHSFRRGLVSILFFSTEKYVYRFSGHQHRSNSRWVCMDDMDSRVVSILCFLNMDRSIEWQMWSWMDVNITAAADWNATICQALSVNLQVWICYNENSLQRLLVSQLTVSQV